MTEARLQIGKKSKHVQERLSRQLIETVSERRMDDTNLETTFAGSEAFEKPGPKKVDLESLTVVPAEG
jgi:hypothetical protein